MRRKHTQVRYGFYRFRMFTNFVVVAAELAGLIGCAVIMGLTETALAPQAVPGIVYYILFLAFEVTFGSYFTI